MRESQTNKFSPTEVVSGSQPEAKSLFRKILRISPCGSRFCPGSATPAPASPLGMSILGEWRKKISTDIRYDPGWLGHSVGLGEQLSQAILRHHFGAAARESSRQVINLMCS
jgi:hypothetical protein